MKSVVVSLLAVNTLLVILSGVAAAASTLVTLPIMNPGNNSINCRIFNAGTTSQTVQVQAMAGDFNNTVLEDSGTITLFPGEGWWEPFPLGVSGNTFYCKFIVGGTPSSVRAAAYSINTSSGAVAVYPAQ
jgi:hypothetical protein